jgi:hypothetical protein
VRIGYGSSRRLDGDARTWKGSRLSGLVVIRWVVFVRSRPSMKGLLIARAPTAGIAIRCGQDINMHIASRRPPKESSHALQLALRKALSWRCMCMLDLQLALQLGRPPAITFSERETPLCELYEDLLPANKAAEGRSSLIGRATLSVFDASHTLLGIIWTIQQKLYLGGKPHAGDVAPIERALDAWHHNLPKTHVVHLGGRPSLGVVCLHLLHQTAVLLLFRPL